MGTPTQRAAALPTAAFTVRYEPADADKGSVGDFLDDVPAGAVVVIDNAGRTDCTVWGGIMTQTAAVRGVAGTVVHGACRDVATSVEADYPLFRSGRFMRTGKDRVRLAAVGARLSLGGVPVAPDDLVRGDVPATNARRGLPPLREPAHLVELAVVRRAADPSPLVAQFVRHALPTQ
ncbi:DlpA protein [Streptomyces himastatinicus ATCC 53653]|uniref:Putative 4-hydroxy-4-methyl-2-oxoglutarate aldolase n=1 Tax=Streptomyces himastatinicus ATCC 53653 TaxID=457427 RepID=D9W9B0_9ACTN|nr:RraA family protein [Streptomyces himastatinicus]EFL20598.1 DlpA protein [Streptomyces himastatinicus ATCC 53653]